MAQIGIDIHDALVLGGMASRGGTRGLVVDTQDDRHGIRVLGPIDAENEGHWESGQPVGHRQSEELERNADVQHGSARLWFDAGEMMYISAPLRASGDLFIVLRAFSR